MEIHSVIRLSVLSFIASVSWSVTDGYVVKVDSATVYIDWGTASGVKTGDQFSIYRSGDELKHPVTKESLGRAETTVGQGVIEHVAEKHSTGRVWQPKEDLRAADRVRLLATPIAPAGTGTTAAAGDASVLPTSGLKEIWRSKPLEGNPRALAIGDVDGDKQADVVVATTDQLEFFSWKDGALVSRATFANRRYPRWMTVDIANVSGKNQIFATHFQDGVARAKVIVVEWNGKELVETGSLDGFSRVFPRLDGTAPLYTQQLSMSRELRLNDPRRATVDGGKFKSKDTVKFRQKISDDQLFGYAFGDWDKDGTEDEVYLQRGERLRFFLKEAKVTAADIYGGTKNDFTYTHEKDTPASVYPRLVSWTSASGQPLLLAPHNIPKLGIRFTYLKVFDKSEIVALGWTGSEMAPIWKLAMAGYLADFGVGDVSNAGAPQLWTALDAGGDKTVLIAYALPH